MLISFPQNDSIVDNSEFNRALNVSSQKKINNLNRKFDKASVAMGKALVYEKQIDDILANSRRAKTRKVSKLEEKKMQKEIEAFYIYQNLYKKLFKIYRKSLKEFRDLSVDPVEGISLEKNAKTSYKKSKRYNNKAENKGNIEKAHKLFSDAYNQEIAAINFQIEAFSHYTSTRNVEKETLVAEEISEQPDTLFQDNTHQPSDTLLITEPEEDLPEPMTENIDSSSLGETIIDSSFIVPAAIISPDTDSPDITDTTETVQADTLVADPLVSIVSEPDTMPLIVEEESPDLERDEVDEETRPEVLPADIFFGIQILSRTSPASPEQLRQIYKGSEESYLIQSNGYYRYHIGKFKTLFEAKVFKQKETVEGFIVAYKNGERIPVQEATDLLKKQ